MSKSRWIAGLCALGLGCGQPPVVIDAGIDAGTDMPKPQVLLLIDTSGSMSYRADCECPETGSCSHCLPDCNAGERPRWHDVLDAVTGRLLDYGCTEWERTAENGATYDEQYSLPFYRFADTVRQLSDGVLDRYRDQVQFGLATFDSMRTYRDAGDLVTLFDVARSEGVEGMFSYGSVSGGPRTRPDGTVVGRLRYPTATQAHFVDNGIRNARATEGALIMPGDADVIAQIKSQLLGVRPYGGTPTAAALDDLYFAFSEAAATNGKRHVILLTDGIPDDDFREYPNPGCACALRGDCPPDEDPDLMGCPYPTAYEAAEALRCGYDESGCAGPVDALHVVVFADPRDHALNVAQNLASLGGGNAFEASGAEALTLTLDVLLSNLVHEAM